MNINLCITNLPLPTGYGSQIWVYADPTGLPPFNGTYIVGPIPVSSITSPNCPYSVTVPNGTTVIRFIDENGDPDCYTDIPVEPIEICEDCTFSFDSFDNNQIGSISVGNLISSGSGCTPLNSYLIQWYDSNGTYQFSSGAGINYSGLPVRNYTHPLIGSSSVPVISGQYYPVLVAVTINGVSYSTVGTGGSLYNDFSNCNLLEDGVSVVVNNYTCEPSSTSDDPNYDHKVFFNSVGGSGQLPVPSFVAITPSNTTTYLALKFKGDIYSDKLKVELFTQSNPGNPILLEDITVGLYGNTGYFSSNQNLNSSTLTPKLVTTSNFFHKLIPLTGLTIDLSTDYIKISVTPNSLSINPATNWTLYFTCLDTFNCDLCSDDTSGFKLCASGLTINYSDNSCLYDLTKLEFDVLNPCYPETNLDPKTYLGAVYPENEKNEYSYYSNGALSLGGGGTYGCYFCRYGNSFTSFPTGSLGKLCQQGNGFIIYNKGFNGVNGILTIEFGSFTGPNNDRQKYINYWNQAVSYYYSSSTKCGDEPTGIPSDTIAKYYQFIRMAIPQNFGSPINGGPDTPCGDNIVFKTDILLHPSSVIDTSIPDAITWTIPIITNNYVPLSAVCGACQQNVLTPLLTLANNYTQLNEGPIQNNLGAIYNGGGSLSPFYQNFGPFYSAILFSDGGPSPANLTANTISNYNWNFPTYDTNIIKYTQTLWPFSGAPSTPIPSLSGEVCDYNTSMELLQNYYPPYNIYGSFGTPYYGQNVYAYHRLNYWYKWYLVDPLVDDKWFRIVTRSFNSIGQMTGPEITIFERDSTSIIVPPTGTTYWDCIGPTVVDIKPNNYWTINGDVPWSTSSYFNFCTTQSFAGWNIPMRYALSNGYTNFDVLTWEILAEDLSLPGTSPGGYLVRWNVTNIPSGANNIGVGGYTSNPFGPSAIIGPTDVVGCTSSHGWCGPCSTPSSSYPIRITVTANLAPSAGGGTAVGVVQFTL